MGETATGSKLQKAILNCYLPYQRNNCLHDTRWKDTGKLAMPWPCSWKCKISSTVLKISVLHTQRLLQLKAVCQIMTWKFSEKAIHLNVTVCNMFLEAETWYPVILTDHHCCMHCLCELVDACNHPITVYSFVICKDELHHSGVAFKRSFTKSFYPGGKATKKILMCQLQHA